MNNIKFVLGIALFIPCFNCAMVMPSQKYDIAATNALKSVLNEIAHEPIPSKIQEKFKDVRDLILAGADPNTTHTVQQVYRYSALTTALTYNRDRRI